MIVNDGRKLLLDAQDSYTAGLYWFLFENDVTPSATTVYSDLTTGTFTGYAPVLVGLLTPAAIVAGRAQKTPNVAPVFTNSGGTDAILYGWGLYDNSGGKLVAAVRTGAITIPAGLSFVISAAITDTQE